MFRKNFHLAVFAFVMLWLTACSTAQAAPPSQVSDSGGDTPRTITVNGVGRVSATPDIARISIGVETRGESAAKATLENSELAQEVIATLEGFDIAQEEIRTVNFSVFTREERDRDGNLLSVTYVVQNTVQVTVRDLETLGAVLDGVVQSGANNISGIQFDLSDRVGATSQALEAAVEDARRQAEILTAAAGVDLGQVLTINSFSSIPVFPVQRAAIEFAAPGSDVPISQGELELSVDVTVVYELQ